MKEISLHILDIVQNSITAGARNISVHICEESQTDSLTIRIADDGCGMDEETVARVQSPFVTSRNTRRVGLGIPLFKAGCLTCGGSFAIQSQVGKGTEITAVYRLSHIDRPPLGDMAGTMYMLITANPEILFHYLHQVEKRELELDGREMRDALDGLPLDDPEVGQWLMKYLQDGMNALYGGADHEEEY